MSEHERAMGPMFVVGYVARTVEPDGVTKLILGNGRAISISPSTATALIARRQRDGSPPIRVVSQCDAQALARQLASRDDNGGSGGPPDGD
jgi:hypothetical protein